ncbi:hypothetical protein F2Q68_00024761 [Brassica cretica]|uniref:Uncharacterized protein n=2 Tax=Brassica cretica TaxID=69181 RepID=A0A8S9ID88_BRACR|nr:hypothetical protein F2Q68_00024761 [Brassica cretica]KAF3577570.1 hypothetical protein DY000_02029995 [Brassica cretica]
MATWITPRASLSCLDRTAFRFVSIGLSVEILRRKQVSSTNRDCPHQLAVWRAERAHLARPMATWITPRASFPSLDRTAFRFVSIGLSVEILQRKQVSSTNRDCPHQLAVWRAERAHSARPMATWITSRASLSSLDRTAFCFVSIGISVEILRRKQVSSTNRDCPHQLALWRAERAHTARPMDHSSSFSLKSPSRRFLFRLDFTIKAAKTCFSYKIESIV